MINGMAMNMTTDMIINTLMIAIIMVFIIDFSGIIEHIELQLSKFLKIPASIPKPFSCSLCMTWWTALIYNWCTMKFTLEMIVIVALISSITPIIYSIWVTVIDLIEAVILKIKIK